MKEVLTIIIILTSQLLSVAQSGSDSLIQEGTLENIIKYSLRYQPQVQKSLLDEKITNSQINSQLADWYPQVDFSFNLEHNFQLQTTEFQGQIIQLGNNNTSTGTFAYNQNIINNNLLLAARTARDIRRLASQTTEDRRINAVASVSKAFYDILLTRQQIRLTEEDIVRLERSVKDAQSQYKNGIVDKTDYKRATIALNNANALKRRNEEALKAKLEYLKSLMGYPARANLEIIYDSLKMESELIFDVSKVPDYTNRIEYQVLQTQKKLHAANVSYTNTAFIPSLTGFAGYNLNYLNNSFPDLYKVNYPGSYAGIALAFPIVHGGKRWMAIRQAKWQLKKADWDLTDMENNIDAQYAQAQAAYLSSYANFTALKENMMLAQEVYNIIQLQYRSGVKTYLEVITAESDLRTSQINYYNALYQVLSSKIDLQKALGQLKY